MITKPLNDCFTHDKDRLTHNEALSILKSNLTCQTKTETIATADALNRVLAKVETACRPIPAHTNTAVDGYAFAHKDYCQKTGTTFQITNRIAAGDALIETLPEKSAAQIFTGAVMPTDYDTIAMQEDVTLKEDKDGTCWVSIPAGLKQNANCRQAGEDTPIGGTLVKAHTQIKPQHIARLASAGKATIEVYAPIKIACLSTGNELITDEKDFTLGKVFDSNGPMLNTLLSTQNCEVTNLGIIKDNKADIEEALTKAAKTHHIIITSGGASKGEEDHIITSLEKLGKRHMWQLAIKPGRPMSFGQIDDCIFIGLPGNPIAAFVCFLLYVTPILARLGGQNWFEPTRFQVPANFKIDKKKSDRREFMRGHLVIKDGITWVEKYQKDGSGLISSLTSSSGLIEIDEATTKLEHGQLVNFLSFSQWGL